MKKVSCVDLFCGAGGLTHGLVLEGLPVVAGIDMDPACKFPYESNNNAKFIERDISKVTTTELDALFGDADIKILAGCAPCQPFSTYTQRYESDGKDGKWGLLYEFARLAEGTRPDVITMENVPTVAKHQVFHDFVEALKCIGYSVWFSIVDCTHFGVPQTRKRMVLLASLHGVVLSPNLAIVDEQCANKPLMLIHTYAQDIDLDATLKIDGWAATPTERMVQLCRSKECRLGLVTNGERWMLVDAPVGAVTSFASWYARLWNQEPITLQAFVHLLGIRRFFVNESEQLPALFDSSLKYQDEVTDALGEQVRRAVEVLIQSLDKADQDRNRELLYNVKESELYEAALTVMMRLVFLLSAEERGLLLLGDERYEANYALSTLRMTFCVDGDVDRVEIEARWGRYERVPNDEHQFFKSNGQKAKVWKRIPCGGKIVLPLIEGSISHNAPDSTSPEVRVQGSIRAQNDNGDRLITLFLVNAQEEPDTNRDTA